jgi:hypothetical protein
LHQQEVRWYMAKFLPFLDLTAAERQDFNLLVREVFKEKTLFLFIDIGAKSRGRLAIAGGVPADCASAALGRCHLLKGGMAPLPRRLGAPIPIIALGNDHSAGHPPAIAQLCHNTPLAAESARQR